ncbi:MAG TPA: DUF1295 domain-containing protein [Steroidobacteraceae bacterium]|nr:DUF1295 domain-containing protein [Steroidobacteraceae bacterium]
MNLTTLAAHGLTAEGIQMLVYVNGVHFLVVLILWMVGRGHKNDSVLDIYWGFSFVVAVWMAYALTADVSARGKLISALVTVWGARLGYHLLSRWARIHGQGGDLRYQDIKDRLSASGSYSLKVLLVVYVPMWLSYALAQLNMLLVIGAKDQPPLTSTDLVSGGVMVAAIALEVVADLQLDAFKANHRNEGRILDYGVWSWSRHPNYFANFCCYWAIFAISLRVPGLLWTVISPLFMSWLLIGFTGKKWMESHLSRRRPGYAQYVARTSGFVPMPPRRS